MDCERKNKWEVRVNLVIKVKKFIVSLHFFYNSACSEVVVEKKEENIICLFYLLIHDTLWYKM